MSYEDDYIDSEVITNENIEKYSFAKGSEFVSCTFVEINFSELNCEGLTFIECTFSKCNLSNIQILNTTFRDVDFKACKLMGVNFSDLKKIFHLRAEESVFDYCVFQQVDAQGIQFINCSLKEVDFSDSKLQKGSFRESNLAGAIFNNANLSGCDFIGAKNYLIDPRLTKIKKAKFSMPDASSFFEALDISIEF